MIKKIFIVLCCILIFCATVVCSFASDSSWNESLIYKYCKTPMNLKVKHYLDFGDSAEIFETHLSKFSDGFDYRYGDGISNYVYQTVYGEPTHIYTTSHVYSAWRDIIFPQYSIVQDIELYNTQLLILDEETTSNQLRFFAPYATFEHGKTLVATIEYKVMYSYYEGNTLRYDYLTFTDTLSSTPALPPTPVTIRGQQYIQYNFAKFPNLTSRLNQQESYYPNRNYRTFGYITIRDYSMSIFNIDTDNCIIRDLSHFSDEDIQSNRVDTLREHITENHDVDVDFTDWIVTAIQGIMNFYLIPGISIGAMLALCVGIGLFIMFLKIWAGG